MRHEGATPSEGFSEQVGNTYLKKDANWVGEESAKSAERREYLVVRSPKPIRSWDRGSEKQDVEEAQQRANDSCDDQLDPDHLPVGFLLLCRERSYTWFGRDPSVLVGELSNGALDRRRRSEYGIGVAAIAIISWL